MMFIHNDVTKAFARNIQQSVQFACRQKIGCYLYGETLDGGKERVWGLCPVSLDVLMQKASCIDEHFIMCSFIVEASLLADAIVHYLENLPSL